MKPYLAALLLALTINPAAADQQIHHLARADGSLIHYTLDSAEGESAGLLVLSQGSGCKPAAGNPALASVRAAFPAYTTLIVEKAGIAPHSTIADGYGDCPHAFHDRYTISQRVDDYRAVLDALESENTLAGHLILFGGSEGGLAMAMLSAHVRPKATILMASATGLSFGEMVRSTVPPEGHASIDAGFAAARANPNSSERFAGSTYRFWADSLDRRTIDHMRQTDTPFLLLQGGLDLSNPLAAARLTADAFASEGRCNLTYWEFPALDHGMVDPNGLSHLPDIARLAAQWARAPLPAC